MQRSESERRATKVPFHRHGTISPPLPACATVFLLLLHSITPCTGAQAAGTMVVVPVARHRATLASFLGRPLPHAQESLCRASRRGIRVQAELPLSHIGRPRGRLLAAREQGARPTSGTTQSCLLALPTECLRHRAGAYHGARRPSQGDARAYASAAGDTRHPYTAHTRARAGEGGGSVKGAGEQCFVR